MLLKQGYFQTAYFPSSYWTQDYWPEYAAALAMVEGALIKLSDNLYIMKGYYILIKLSEDVMYLKQL